MSISHAVKDWMGLRRITRNMKVGTGSGQSGAAHAKIGHLSVEGHLGQPWHVSPLKLKVLEHRIRMIDILSCLRDYVTLEQLHYNNTLTGQMLSVIEVSCLNGWQNVILKMAGCYRVSGR